MAADRIEQLTVTVEWVDDTPYIHELRGPDHDHDHWLPALQDAISEAIRRYPNFDAEWWIGPSAVLGVIERHLAGLLPPPPEVGADDAS